jgi:hypothetical protein
MGYWTGSGVDDQFYSVNVTCDECDGDYEAEFYTDSSTGWVKWTCESPKKNPWWAFWRPKICGYENSREVEV